MLEIWSESLVAIDELGDVKASGSEESQGIGGVFTGEGSALRSVADGGSEAIFSVESPHSLEMSLGADCGWHLVREEHRFLFDHLWANLGHGIVLGLEQSSALLGCGVDSEVGFLFLISMSE